ncbi:MAG TPA: fructosamine kinase family protein [Patescibacteria group bacterium]|nr:fructosamine kinase family protein [Patescibacteria group bacterium]
MISPGLKLEVERELKGRITTIAPLSAANNAQIYRIVLDNRRVMVAKVAERGLDTEAYMLHYLKTRSRLPVPQVFYSNEHIIVMEFVETQYGLDDNGQKIAADILADLHSITADQYGFERDTLIGSLRQPNPQTSDWPKFFAEQRLLYMGREALKENKIDAKTMKALEKAAARAPDILKGCAGPALIHGDVWGGNILACRGRIAAFLDPAIYFADPEVELAFIRLFTTFGDPFFARYNELRPIRAGFFEQRSDYYNIYPLLVHTRLFGASYARKVQRLLEKFT